MKSITDNLKAENGVSRRGLCRKWSPSEDWTTFNQISIGSPARLLPQPALLFRVISGNICMSCWTPICQTRPIYTACMSENSCSLCQLTMTEITSVISKPNFSGSTSVGKRKIHFQKQHSADIFSSLFVRTPSLVINASVSLCSLCIFLTSSHFKKLTVNPVNSPQASIYSRV